MIDFLYSRYEVIKHIACKKKIEGHFPTNLCLTIFQFFFFFSFARCKDSPKLQDKNKIEKWFTISRLLVFLAKLILL